MIPTTVTVSPSGFGFLYEECQSCYYHEALGIRKRPRTPFPTVFTTIDRAMKQHFESRIWHRLGERGLHFRMLSQGRWVKSAPIALPGTGVQLVIRGLYDSLIAFEDERRAICDFKTSPVRSELIGKYARQLHSYAHALEHPADGPSQTINTLGLAVFEPEHFSSNDLDAATLRGRFAWLAVERDDAAFSAFLWDVAVLLAGPPPEPNPDCGFCAYREAA